MVGLVRTIVVWTQTLEIQKEMLLLMDLQQPKQQEIQTVKFI